MTPPPHTALYGWDPIEQQRNGDLVLPLRLGGGELLALRGNREACREFAAAILAAVRAEKTPRKTKAGAPKLKPNGRLL
jgi:hypothetical protein